MEKLSELEDKLASLSVVPLKSKKSELEILGILCTRHLENFNFDSTSILDSYLNHRGEFINEEDRTIACELAKQTLSYILHVVMEHCDDSHSEDSKVEEVDSTFDLSPSEVIDISSDDETNPSVPCTWIPCEFPEISTGSELGSQDGVAQDAECQMIVDSLNKKFNEFKSLNVLISCMTAMTIAFGMTVKTVANSGNFDVFVVKSFLEEIVIFLNLMLSQEDTEDLPESWKFFIELAILQTQVFDFYIDADDYDYAHYLIWILSNNTDLQKKFLQRCIDESVGFEDVMSEVGAAIESMLSLQEEFILKLIARLQESKDDQVSTFPNAIQC
jgi:hypothetical protein